MMWWVRSFFPSCSHFFHLGHILNSCKLTTSSVHYIFIVYFLLHTDIFVKKIIIFSYSWRWFWTPKCGGRLIGSLVSERYSCELWLQPCLPLICPFTHYYYISFSLSAFRTSFHFVQKYFFRGDSNVFMNIVDNSVGALFWKLKQVQFLRVKLMVIWLFFSDLFVKCRDCHFLLHAHIWLLSHCKVHLGCRKYTTSANVQLLHIQYINHGRHKLCP